MTETQQKRHPHAIDPTQELLSGQDEFVFRSIADISPTAAQAFATTPTAQLDSPDTIDHPRKIGIGIWDIDNQGTAIAQFESMHFGWYYNWQLHGLEGDDTGKFVPMTWGDYAIRRTIMRAIKSSDTRWLLTFNEPDHAGQANMTVDEAISLWPKLMNTGKLLGSPATTVGGALGENSWLGQFMAEAEKHDYRVNFIAIHYYSGNTDVGAFENFLERLHEAYHRPIWVTEWALVDWSNPDRFTPEQVSTFAHDAIEMMDDLPFVRRHAWFAAYQANGLDINTELYGADGKLTHLGHVFADLL